MNAWGRGRVYTCDMTRARSLPEQRSLFQPDPAGVLASLRDWPDSDLDQLLRVGALELLRRCRAVPIAVPVAQATYRAMAGEVSV